MAQAKKKAPTPARTAVTVAEMAGDEKAITIKRGGSLKDALLAAGYPEADLAALVEDTRVNGKERALKFKLHKGDFITVAARVQGGAL